MRKRALLGTKDLKTLQPCPKRTPVTKSLMTPNRNLAISNFSSSFKIKPPLVLGEACALTKRFFLHTDNVRWGKKRRRNYSAFLNQKTNAVFVKSFEEERLIFKGKMAGG